MGLAQEPPEALSVYGEGIEAPQDAGGVEDEVDAAPAQAAPGAGGPALSPGARGMVEEIVVHARKRQELLVDTPVAVTSLGETLLREANITRFDEIQTLVPNLTQSGGSNDLRITIRGVGTATSGVAFDPGVGVYVDGVFQPRGQSAVFDTVDVEAIEVLRGPQGTLFGKNTVGGAINVTTRKPHESLEGFILVRPGNFGVLNTRSMINVPVRVGWLDGRLFTRLAFASQNRGPVMDNPFLDQPLGVRSVLTTLGSVRFLPADEVTVDVSGLWWKSHETRLGGQCVVVEETPLGNVLPGFYEACRRSTPTTHPANVDRLGKSLNYGVWSTIQWSPGPTGPLDDLSLKSITSWRRQRSGGHVDNDETELPVVQRMTTGPEPENGALGTSQQIQQEVQMNGMAWDGRLNFVSGFFSFWERSERNQATTIQVNRSITSNEIETDNFTWAFYGQATFDLTAWASLTGGLRYTSDRKEAMQTNRRLSRPGAPIVLQGEGAKTFERWTPMASLALVAPEDWLDAAGLDHLMGYFTYAQGFKGGGFNAVINPLGTGDTLASFEPETLDSFEVGFKTIAFDRRLTASVALFRAFYDDIQRRALFTYVDPGGIQQFEAVTLNAASATTQGVEVEAIATPLSGLRVRGTLGYLDARYDSFPNAISNLTGEQLDRSGQTFENTPKWQTFLSAQYSFPVELGASEWLEGWLTPRLQWAYRSRVHILGPEVLPAVQPGFHLLGARLSYDFMDDRAQVALWGRNLLDERFRTGASVAIASSYGTVSRNWSVGRTYGAEISYRF